MDIQELNRLLRPYKISIECKKCEEPEPVPPPPPKEAFTPVFIRNKKRKRITKTSNRESGKKGMMIKNPKFATNSKAKVMSHSPFVNFTKRFSEQKEGESENPKINIGSFFTELKQKMEDNIFRCPQFETNSRASIDKHCNDDFVKTNTSFKKAGTDYVVETTKVDHLKKNLFNKDIFECVDKRPASDNFVAQFALPKDNEEEFAFNFDDLPKFSESFSFD